jgi:hypothetical protein
MSGCDKRTASTVGATLKHIECSYESSEKYQRICFDDNSMLTAMACMHSAMMESISFTQRLRILERNVERILASVRCVMVVQHMEGKMKCLRSVHKSLERLCSRWPKFQSCFYIIKQTLICIIVTRNNRHETIHLKQLH